MQNPETEVTIAVQIPEVTELVQKSGIELTKAEAHVHAFSPQFTLLADLSRPLAGLNKENPTPEDAAASAEKARLEAELLAKEKEAQERKDAEAARIAAEEKAKKDALLAPDKDKLNALAVTFSLVELPELATTEAQLIIENIKILQGKLIAYIRDQSAKM